MQRTERLVAITLLLQARGKMTAERLSRIMDVSVRTIYRDIDTLTLAHVPVTMDHGPGGGFYLPEDYRLDPSTFTSEEAVALAVGGSIANGYRIFESDDGLRRALVKLEAALPPEYRGDVQAARERLLFDTAGWYRQAAPSTAPYLETLRAALWSSRQIDIRYLKRGESREDTAWRRVEPYGLVCKAGIWYLVAYCHTRRDVRTFRVDRVVDLTVREESVRQRKDFNLQEYWDAAQKRFRDELPSITVTMRIDAAARRWLREATVVREEADGGCIIRFTVPGMDAAVGYILSRGVHAEVLDPPEVRENVIRSARGLLEKYAALA